MDMKISQDVLEAYFHCKYKSHLKYTGQQGVRSEYESLFSELRERVRLQAIDQESCKSSGNDEIRDAPLTSLTLKKGSAFIVSPHVEEGPFSWTFDAIKRLQGPSKLGDFHYVPVLFHGHRQVGKAQRLLLDIQALLLSRIQGRLPGTGIIYHGQQCRTKRVRLHSDVRKTEGFLEEIKRQCHTLAPPKLILNDHCHQCEFRQRCHEQAIKEDNLSLLRGMGEKEIKKCARKGIFTLTQFAQTFRPRRKGRRADRRSHHRYHALQAMAVRDKRVYVFGTPVLPASPVTIYLDLEGNPEEGSTYLIGMLVEEAGAEKRYSFWADDKSQEEEIFKQFLSVLQPYENFRVLAYGGYERAFLKRMRKRVKAKEQVDRVLNALVNVLSTVFAHVYFPTYSNGLKEIGSYLGARWSDNLASGIESIAWRIRWEADHDKTRKNELIAYNLEDCAALKRIATFLSHLSEDLNSKEGAPSAAGTDVPITHVSELDKLAGRDLLWRRVQFFHPEFQQINDCSYFDYQRERVFVRSNRRLGKRLAKKRGRHNRTLRVNARVHVGASVCPSCGGKEIVALERGSKVDCFKPRVKRAFDLIFSQGGIRRKVIEVRTSVHQCGSCGASFVPDRYSRLDMHFHGLKSWAMYQHVANRLSLGIVEAMVEEMFGFRIYSNECWMLKSLLARYYLPTYRQLLRRILSGKLLHVDETEFKLRNEKGYVWVFTNLEEVAFIYRPSREGEFLRTLLKKFTGVIVSDFYSAYDSIDAPQQKCLIHLIRDMNQDLLNNPFDEELQSVTRPFGILLRTVIATVDEHGLKRRHLRKHVAEVEDFYKCLSGRLFRSEAAEGLQKRLLKYREKLFTFLRFDNVPWNNNNAENAIKHLAFYRENTVGIMKESGLTDYLVLLSISTSCRYKGVSFLKFLLSRERDLEAFCDGHRLRRRLPEIEVYPKDFVPRIFAKSYSARSTRSVSSRRAVQENPQM